MAPEAANNSVTGGAMIPLLSLGIPGDPATAVMLGGFLIHGLIPGPLLFAEHRADVYVIYLAIFVAYVSVVLFQYFGIRAFVSDVLPRLAAYDTQVLVNVCGDSPEEYAEGHLPGATLIPLDELPARLGELDRGKPTLVYCRSGNRAGSDPLSTTTSPSPASSSAYSKSVSASNE